MSRARLSMLTAFVPLVFALYFYGVYVCAARVGMNPVVEVAIQAVILLPVYLGAAVWLYHEWEQRAMIRWYRAACGDR